MSAEAEISTETPVEVPAEAPAEAPAEVEAAPPATEDVPPPTADLPSGDPILQEKEEQQNSAVVEAAPPPPPPTTDVSVPPKKPSSFSLTSFLAAAPARTDAFLAHLHRCFQTPSGIDTVLLFVCYMSRLSAASLQTATGPAVRRSALQLLALADSLPPQVTLVFTNNKNLFPPPSIAVVLRVARRLKALSVLLSDVRAFMRLWGLLNMYFWGRGLVQQWLQKKNPNEKSATPEKDRVETTISWVQLAACVAFQSLENSVYLAGKGVLEWKPETRQRVGLWSARFWGTFVGIEIGRLLYEARKRSQRSARERIGDMTVAEAERAEREWSSTWRKTLARQLAWAPLTVHWSLEKGLVSELSIGALASIPAVIQIRDLWRRTAE